MGLGDISLRNFPVWISGRQNAKTGHLGKNLEKDLENSARSAAKTNF